TEWSAWSKEDHTEFTNLPEHRHYTFRVRARNAQGVLGEEAAFAFRVLPPWHRTWWAYALYVLAFSVVLWGFSTWRIRAHQRDLEEERMLNQRLDRMNARLAETNERLRRADKLKDDLLANTSHELRTPLTAILGFSAVLREEGDEDQRELAHAIHRSGQRLLETVNGLLDMAKLQANLLELRPAALDVAEVARDVLAMLRPLAEERGLYLRLLPAALAVPAVTDRYALARILINLTSNVLKSPDRVGVTVLLVGARDVLAMLRPLAEERGLYLRLLPEALAVPAVTDRYALERILITLTSNALKFTDRGGVTDLLDGDGDEVSITVRDTGIGMEAEFLPHLFDAFKQASTGYSRSHEGSGLGLTIVKRVVELLGGHIGVESTPGEGTTFEVVLPRHLGSGDGAPARTTGGPFLHVSEPVLGGARLLALASTAETQERLRAFVGDLCTLVVAETPRAALREAKAAPFDVVLVERRAGDGEDACEVLAAIRALPGYARIPVTVLTDAPDGGTCAVQPDHVLALPLERDPLLQRLEALLTRADGAVVT